MHFCVENLESKVQEFNAILRLGFDVRRIEVAGATLIIRENYHVFLCGLGKKRTFI